MRLSRFRWTRLALLLLLAAWPLAAADTLSPFDIARLRSVSAVAISPDGSRIAYTLSVPRRTLEEEDGAAWAELHVVGRDGVSRPFVTGAANVADVAWTKEGREISFIAKRGKDEQRCLYSISADGGEGKRLLCHETDITSYSFAPDGKRVAFLASAETPKRRRTSSVLKLSGERSGAERVRCSAVFGARLLDELDVTIGTIRLGG